MTGTDLDPRTRRGIPTARNVDHVAYTVADLERAVAFFVDVLGGELVYREGPIAREDDWMAKRLDVHPRAVAASGAPSRDIMQRVLEGLHRL